MKMHIAHAHFLGRTVCGQNLVRMLELFTTLQSPLSARLLLNGLQKSESASMSALAENWQLLLQEE
jgi:hypothetical protein